MFYRDLGYMDAGATTYTFGGNSYENRVLVKEIRLNRICVFAGSSSGKRVEYAAAARELGRALARRRIGLVYGGARVGLMGTLADEVLSGGGHVIGVMPRRWSRRKWRTTVSPSSGS
jgi:predicted Rossmann-fold nucleotide-binding protein